MDVLICSFGPKGLEHLALHTPPRMQGVRYVVSWQLPDGDAPVPVELVRNDIEVYKYATRGLSCNRNHALAHLKGKYGLIADDDLIFLPSGLNEIIRYFDANPDVDIVTGRFIGNLRKTYPSESFDLAHPPKGYYVSSIEIAFRTRSVIEAGVSFDLRFGVGAPFRAYEEALWLHQLQKRGLKGAYIPVDFSEHHHPSTGEYMSEDAEFIVGKGAFMKIVHPWTWTLRMLAHALPGRRPAGLTLRTYLSAWLKGAFSVKY